MLRPTVWRECATEAPRQASRPEFQARLGVEGANSLTDGVPQSAAWGAAAEVPHARICDGGSRELAGQRRKRRVAPDYARTLGSPRTGSAIGVVVKNSALNDVGVDRQPAVPSPRGGGSSRYRDAIDHDTLRQRLHQ